MTTLVITLPQERLDKLQEIAARLQVTPEALATTSIVELLTRPDAAFEHAVNYILQKNMDLYRRLK